MTYARAVVLTACLVLCLLPAPPSTAADGPAPKEGHWVVRDFRFHTGEVLPELKLAYTTIGDPKNEAIVVLHGTAGSAVSYTHLTLPTIYSV